MAEISNHLGSLVGGQDFRQRIAHLWSENAKPDSLNLLLVAPELNEFLQIGDRFIICPVMVQWTVIFWPEMLDRIR